MTDTIRRPTIVVAVDLSEYSDAVLVHAFDQAARIEHPSLHVVAVVPDEGRLWHRPTEAELAAVEQRTKSTLVELVLRVLEDAVPAATRADWHTRLHVRRGRPDEQIIELSEEVNADLLVLGRYGHAARGKLGSTADRILAEAECPVLLVSGVRDHSASDQQCPDCVAVRAESDGERWFCDAHHGGRVTSTVGLRGGTYARDGW